MQMPFDVLHHHDCIVDDQTDREDDREQRQQVDREARRQHQEDGADERDGNGDHGNDDRAERAQEQEDDDDDDQERFGERSDHFADGVFDVLGRVVRHADLHPRRQLRLDLRNRFAHLPDHVERVRRGQHPDAHERRGLAVEADILFVVLRSQHDVGNFAEADDRAVLLLHDELPEFFGSS